MLIRENDRAEKATCVKLTVAFLMLQNKANHDILVVSQETGLGI